MSELRRQGLPAGDILWVGTRGQMEEQLVPQNGLRLETIQGGPVVGLPWLTRMKNVAKLGWSLGPANRLMARFKPAVLLLTGGYVNVPVALVAWLRRVPAVIYLPDIEPGSAIRFLSRFAGRVACTAAESGQFFPAGKITVTGYPVRPELRQASQQSKAEALAQFQLQPGRATLFVFGGSRGARSINQALIAILPQLLSHFQVIHISGNLDWPEVEKAAKQLNSPFYRPYPYLHEQMGAAFRAADLVLARAGASMLGEGPAFGLPAVLVPYPHAWRYQKVNADYLAGRGAAVRLEDSQLAQQLWPTLQQLLGNPTKLAEMSQQARQMDIPDAAGRLATVLTTLAKGELNNG